MTALRLLFFGDSTITLPPFEAGTILLIGQTHNKDELKRFCKENHPQMLLMQGKDDLHFLKTLITECREINPLLKVIVFAEYSDLSYTRAVISAGAMGYITELHNLVSVLHTVQSGKLVLSPQITRLLFLSA